MLLIISELKSGILVIQNSYVVIIFVKMWLKKNLTTQLFECTYNHLKQQNNSHSLSGLQVSTVCSFQAITIFFHRFISPDGFFFHFFLFFFCCFDITTRHFNGVTTTSCPATKLLQHSYPILGLMILHIHIQSIFCINSHQPSNLFLSE